jgi:hypothetical protein
LAPGVVLAKPFMIISKSCLRQGCIKYLKII